MQKIKFSHEYLKMPNLVINRVTHLVGVSLIHYKDLPDEFRKYDTMYSIDNKNINYYQLPRTQLLLLTLFTYSEQSHSVWTTIRRFTPEKHDYYNKLIGQEVKIVLTSTLPSATSAEGVK